MILMRTDVNCAKTSLLILLLFLAVPMNSLGASSGREKSRQEQEEETFLRNVKLPTDPRRTPDEQYYDRFRITMDQGQGRDLVVAQWREGGSFVGEAIDIFVVEQSSGKLIGRRVYSQVLGGEVLLVLKEDLDGDKKEDLIFIHKTGGMIATKGVLALLTTRDALSEVFSYIGTDVLVFRERGQLRVLVKVKSDGKVEEFNWNSTNKTFQKIRSFELLY